MEVVRDEVGMAYDVMGNTRRREAGFRSTWPLNRVSLIGHTMHDMIEAMEAWKALKQRAHCRTVMSWLRNYLIKIFGNQMQQCLMHIWIHIAQHYRAC